MPYSVMQYQDIEELQTYHPGPAVPVAATVMGIDYPLDEAFTVYVWDFHSLEPESWPEVVKPTIDPTDNGRWLKVDLSSPIAPQVNSDWNATAGPAQILNKPAIPAPQVSSDWTAVSGVARILNKPTLSAVALTGNYNDLLNKPAAPGALTVGGPNSRSLLVGSAYQATDTTKPAIVTITFNSTASLSLSGGTTVLGEVRIGSTNSVATGGGTAVGSYKNSLTGTLAIGLNIQTDSYNTVTFVLPAGWFFSPRQVSGTGLQIVSAFDQSISN